jgi:hypothetical protein
MVRQIGRKRGNTFLHTGLPSPFLQNFDSFRSWRRDIHRRLAEWRAAAPKPEDIGVKFSVDFLELNYWQALIMLYQQSLGVPPPLAGEVTRTDDISSPSMTNIDGDEDEDEIYVKVAEAGQQVLRIYCRLHRHRLVNYTFLATHHLFTAGQSPFCFPCYAYLCDLGLKNIPRCFVFVCNLAFTCSSQSPRKYTPSCVTERSTKIDSVLRRLTKSTL